MLMAPWTATRPDWWPRAILSVLALITRRPSLPLSDTPPFALSLLWLPWRTWNFALWTFLMPTSMALLKRRSTCSSLRDLKWVDRSCLQAQEIALWPQAGWQGLEPNPLLCSIFYGLQ